MNAREQTIELLAQTIAPRLFQLYGTKPEDMGFPIYDTEAEVREHLARQLDPVSYWLDVARDLSGRVVRIVESGGVDVAALDVDAMCKAASTERPDINHDGTQSSLSEL